MDIFTEYIVKKTKETVDYLITAGLIVAAIILTVLFIFINVFGLGFVLAAGAWWGAVYLISMRNVEFEYILTNADVDVDKIMGRRRRKRIISFHCKEIKLCARIHDPAFASQYENTKDTKILNLAGDLHADNVYFVDLLQEGEKKRILFQPNTKMIEAIQKFNPRVVNL